MELKNYLEILNRRKWIVIVTLAVTVVVALAGRLIIPEKHRADATIRVDLFFAEDPTFSQLVYAERIMNTYANIATSGPVLDELRDRLDLDRDQPSDVEATIIPDSELLHIVVEDQDPLVAWDSASTLLDIVVNDRLYEEVILSVVDPPELSSTGSLRSILSLLFLAVVIGICGGVGLAFFVEYLDDGLYSIEQIKTVTGLPILGQIPDESSTKNESILDGSPIYNDAFRRLQINVNAVYSENEMTSLLITSANPEEGKSTIAVNLATSMSLTGKHTLLIDADLYHPTVHKYLGLTNDVGLSDILLNGQAPPEVVQTTHIPELSGLTSGPVPNDPAELLGSEQIIELVNQVSHYYDFVIVDTPAYLGVAGVGALAPTIDGVLLIVRQNQVKETDLHATYQQLVHVNANLIGMVINGTKWTMPRRYQKYYAAPSVEGRQGEASRTVQPESQEPTTMQEGDKRSGVVAKNFQLARMNRSSIIE